MKNNSSDRKLRISKPDKDKIGLKGVLKRSYRDGLFDVEVGSNFPLKKGRISGKLHKIMKARHQRLLIGDTVLIEFSVTDLNFGLITRRLKDEDN